MLGACQAAGPCRFRDSLLRALRQGTELRWAKGSLIAQAADSQKRQKRRLRSISMMLRALLIYVLCAGTLAFGQNPDYNFYREFRNVFTPDAWANNPSTTNDQIVEDYAAKLRAEGVRQAEVARRVSLIRTSRPRLESDYWNRFYTAESSKFNRAPNAFVMKIVEDMRPGIALDYAMGEGRNSIYLAQLGWEVWGFDPADAAIALAQERATKLGLTLHTAAVRDSEFDFGKERFDLIVFSWAMPLVPIETVLDALKPGGTVVMEAAADYVGRNGMAKMFDALRIVRYEIVVDTADFYGRRQTDIVRMVAVKP